DVMASFNQGLRSLARLTPWLVSIRPFGVSQFSIAKANNVSPAETTRYCVPSRSYVIGPLLMEAPRLACHRGSPVRAFIATKLPDGSPVKTKLPAVLKTP